jgi:sugar phosphate isomerase/epimerase
MTEIRTGYVTQTHTGAVPVSDAITWGEALGFDFVELYLDGASERTRIDQDAVAAQVADADLDLLAHLPFVDLDLGSARDRIREASLAEHRACLDAVAEMGGEKAVLHASSHATPPEFDPADVKPRLLDAVRDLDAYAADRDVELCVENLPGVPLTIEDFDAVFADTDAAMTLDTGHARVEGYDAADTADFLAAHADRVSHVHVNDARMDADEHVPTGSGTTDFRRIFEPVRAGEWTGTVSVEVFTFDRDYLQLSKQKLDGYL